MKTLLISWPLLLAGLASGEIQSTRKVSLSSGLLANPTGEMKPSLVGQVTAPGAARVRVPLDQISLGTASRIRFTSLADGQSQTLGAAQLADWAHTSAAFNGDTVRVELLLAAGDSHVSVVVKRLFAFSNEVAPTDGSACCGGTSGPKSLCGPDNRVASTDNRAGRIVGGCTGWLVSNGALLTAGHCGVVAGSIFEVNVPASLANGAQVNSAIEDQYPVLAGSITTADSGSGNDWTVCRLGPNSLGQSVFQHGFFRMTRELPAASATTRVTGCGIDNSPLGSQPTVCGNTNSSGTCTHFGLNAQNKTLQTSTGTFTGETGSGSAISLSYAVDTEPANSGSPIIWEATGFAIGIHTNGGCAGAGTSNSGTSFELDALENAIAAVPGANCRYLDLVKAPGGAENGTVFQPHDTLTEAINAVPNGGTLSAVTGSYGGAGTTLTKPMTIRAPVGNVILGN
jgi:V8-like Glu-specific endopeptidase